MLIKVFYSYTSEDHSNMKFGRSKSLLDEIYLRLPEKLQDSSIYYDYYYYKSKENNTNERDIDLQKAEKSNAFIIICSRLWFSDRKRCLKEYMSFTKQKTNIKRIYPLITRARNVDWYNNQLFNLTKEEFTPILFQDEDGIDITNYKKANEIFHETLEDIRDRLEDHLYTVFINFIKKSIVISGNKSDSISNEDLDSMKIELTKQFGEENIYFTPHFFRERKLMGGKDNFPSIHISEANDKLCLEFGKKIIFFIKCSNKNEVLYSFNQLSESQDSIILLVPMDDNFDYKTECQNYFIERGMEFPSKHWHFKNRTDTVIDCIHKIFKSAE